MPWSGPQFAQRHNRKLSGAAAGKAARVATGMVNAGVPESEAIATANKIGDRAMFRGKRFRSTGSGAATRRTNGR